MKEYKFAYLERSRFLMANMYYVLNLDTMQFEVLEDISRFVCSMPRFKRPRVVIQVPLYLWKYLGISTGETSYAPDGLGVLYKLVTYIEFPTFKIALNMPTVEYNPFTPEVEILDGSKSVIVDFNIVSDGWTPETVSYLWEINGVVHSMSHPVVSSLFRHLNGLSILKLHKTSQNWLSFGLTERKLEIEYKDKYIKRQLHAFIYGPIAILLDDELKFNSLVSLISVSDKCLAVRQFLYTVDTYMVKLVTLQR